MEWVKYVIMSSVLFVVIWIIMWAKHESERMNQKGKGGKR